MGPGRKTRWGAGRLGRLLAAGLLLCLAAPAAAQSDEPAAEGKDLDVAIRQSARDIYLIGPSDVLDVTVWREDAISRPEVVVRPDGRISLPLVDDLMAAGRTPMQLKEVLTKRLKVFVEAPKVFITVREARSHFFAVMGEVNKPGRYPMLTPTTVLQGLAAGEGFTEWAKKKNIAVIRGLGRSQKRLPFNYATVIEGEGLEQNVVLEPGDVIVVP